MARTSLAAFGVCLGALVTAAAAQAEGTYLKGDVAGGFADRYSPGSGLDDNWRAGIGIGTNVTPHIRLEGEYIRNESNFKTTGGHSKADIGMANAYYDFGDGKGFTPFVGAGAGYGHFDTAAGDDNSVTYQATAGISKAINNRLTGEVAYKYLDAPDLHLGATDTKYRSSFAGVGFRYRLGG